VRILRNRIERKIEDLLGDRFGFRRGTGTRVAIGMLRIISMNFVHGRVNMCFIDWQEACNCVNWTKLMQILKLKWYQLLQKNIGQQTVQGSEC
jgi:hypothetical protein